jgi:two-component system KDP operon response regulator KdpE
MPGEDGLTLLRRIAADGVPHVPTILLTGRGQISDKVSALDLGADDYLVKPCSDRELIARIRAVWRRSRAADKSQSAGDLSLDLAAHDFYLKGRRIDVTANEFILLQTLIEQAGRVVRYQTLMMRIWGSSVSRDLLRVTVFRLRQKIEADPKAPQYILTVPSVGFILHGTAGPVGLLELANGRMSGSLGG